MVIVPIVIIDSEDIERIEEIIMSLIGCMGQM